MIHETFSSVRRRLWIARSLKGLCWGLTFGATAALLYSLIQLQGSAAIAWGPAAMLIAAGGLLGLCGGALRRSSPQEAARLVDEACALKDASVTALQFSGEGETDPIRRLQIQATESQLKTVQPAACVPLRPAKRPLRWTGVLTLATIAVLIVGNWRTAPVVARTTLPLAQDQAAFLKESVLADVEELKEQFDDPRIEELLEELEEKVEQLDHSTMDEEDLFATLSEMEQAIAQAMAGMQLDQTDMAFKELAEAIKPSEMLQQAADALENEDYEKAAEQFEGAETGNMSDKQRRAVADNLKKMVSKLKSGKQGQLSDAISDLAKSLDSKNQSECKNCLSKLASLCRSQSQCKSIGQCMACQLNRLSQCKGQCRGQGSSNIAKRSNSPSTSAGSAVSGQPLSDEATSIDSMRTEQQLTGAHSDGPSETEMIQAPEGEQQAARQFAAKYNKFRREAEAVLDSEPLPMGHRETVRTYFEAIRPKNGPELEP